MECMRPARASECAARRPSSARLARTCWLREAPSLPETWPPIGAPRSEAVFRLKPPKIPKDCPAHAPCFARPLPFLHNCIVTILKHQYQLVNERFMRIVPSRDDGALSHGGKAVPALWAAFGHIAGTARYAPYRSVQMHKRHVPHGHSMARRQTPSHIRCITCMEGIVWRNGAG